MPTTEPPRLGNCAVPNPMMTGLALPPASTGSPSGLSLVSDTRTKPSPVTTSIWTIAVSISCTIQSGGTFVRLY